MAERQIHLTPPIAVAGALLFGTLVAIDLPAPIKTLALIVALTLTVTGGPVAGASLVFASLPLWMFDLHLSGSIWSPLELALLACGASVAFAALTEVVRQRTLGSIRDWLPERDLVLLGSALVLLAVLSLLWIADKDLRPESIRSLRRVIVEPLAVVPALVSVRRINQQRSVLNWLAASAVIVALLALFQFVSGHSTVDLGGFSRPIGTFTHPNNLAFFLERAVWFVPICGVAVRFGDRRLRLAVMAVVALACLVTLSRGAALGLLAGGCVLFWEELWKRRRLIPLIAIPVVAFTFGSRFLADRGESVESRELIWRSSISMIRDHPFTGVGLDQFLGQYGRRYIDPAGWNERYTSHPHNIVLDFWLSLGIGGLAVLWLFAESFTVRLRNSLAMPTDSIQRAAVAMLVAGVTHGLIDNSFFLPDLAAFTWIGLTLASSARREKA